MLVTHIYIRSVTVISPDIGSGRTKTTFLLEKTQKELATLSNQNDPGALMQYALALTMQLNDLSSRAADSEQDPERGTRIVIREAITLAINQSLHINTLDDVRQAAFLLDQITVRLRLRIGYN